MEIVKESLNETEATIRVKIISADYKQAVEKSIKEYQKKAAIPGFRPGMVPRSVISLRFGRSILAEEVEHLLSDSLRKYIMEQKLNIVGEPIAKESPAELMPDKAYDFAFEVGMVRPFPVQLSPAKNFTLYQVAADDKLIDEYIEEMRLRYGNLTHPEMSEDGDMLVGDFVELDAAGEVLPSGIFKASAINLKKIPATRSKEKFTGRREGDTITLKMDEITAEPREVAALLDIAQDKAKTLVSSFRFNVKHVHRIIPAEVNQQWWDRLFGPGKVNNSEDFRNRVKQEILSVFAPQAIQKMEHEMIDYLMKNTAITLPEAFLKKWLARTHDTQPTEAQKNIEYEAYTNSLKWRLIEDKLVKDNNITVEKKDIEDYVHALAHGYLGSSASEEQVSAAAKNLLQNEKEVKRIYERLYDIKLTDLLKKSFTIESKEVSRNEFEQIMEKTNS